MIQLVTERDVHLQLAKSEILRGSPLDSNEKQAIIDQLFESEAQKKAIFEGFCGIMILFDRDMKAQWVNKGVYLKYPDAIGKTCHDIFCSQTDKCEECAFLKSLQSGSIELSTQRIGSLGKDGDETVFDITASPVKGQDDTVSGVIVIAQKSINPAPTIIAAR